MATSHAAHISSPTDKVHSEQTDTPTISLPSLDQMESLSTTDVRPHSTTSQSSRSSLPKPSTEQTPDTSSDSRPPTPGSEPTQAHRISDTKSTKATSTTEVESPPPDPHRTSTTLAKTSDRDSADGTEADATRVTSEPLTGAEPEQNGPTPGRCLPNTSSVDDETLEHSSEHSPSPHTSLESISTDILREKSLEIPKLVSADAGPRSSSDSTSADGGSRASTDSSRSLVHSDEDPECQEESNEMQPVAENARPSTPVHSDSLLATEEGETPHDEAGPATPKVQHDSMVTVRLSEPPTLTVQTPKTAARLALQAKSRTFTDTTQIARDLAQVLDISTTAEQLQQRGSRATLSVRSVDRFGFGAAENDAEVQSESDEEVDWDQLEKTEDAQVKDEDTDNSTALLLARLDEENAKLATNPKSVKVTSVEQLQARRPRPPSMAQLRQMVNGPAPSSLRYSLVPPPPMTDLEFYAALVKDYQQTAARLPTLLANKIRKGIPPPLRGVVWQSMSGAREAELVEQYERLSGESSPYEPIIVKDLGRSFPGVDMFRDADGDGQRMLGRVLKAFSLYDTKIGYCQGLAFLVGPLLMHMPDKEAFCVLVRLMQRYGLRTCFLPDLSGLHVRIYQFRELLRQTLPDLAGHLEELQVDPAYVSQWFLSFFAVTCPLPMLFRIYDVVFAEGATETLMRVALALMRKNEARLLACTELEDALGLLLSRGLWDCYGYNADEFVDDFVSLTSEVSKEKLSQLETGYRETLVAAANTVRTSDITTAASRFLGRIWASSAILPPKTPTMPSGATGLSAPPRPLSMLRRSPSKQSLTSTLNSVEATSASITSSTSTDATNMSRDSGGEADALSRDSTPVGNKTTSTTKPAEDRHLHSQIEDLLMALSELQRDHALLSSQLELEREERGEDGQAVRSLLSGLRRKAAINQDSSTEEMEVGVEAVEVDEDEDEEADANLANQATPSARSHQRVPSDDATIVLQREEPLSTDDLSQLLNQVERRFKISEERKSRRSSTMHTKAQLKAELAQLREQLAYANTRAQEQDQRAVDTEAEVRTLKEQLRESHSHARSLHQDKQKLERQMHGMRVRGSLISPMETANKEPESDSASKGPVSGLRELKLGRSKSTPSQPGGTPLFNKRVSSLTKEMDASGAPATSSSSSASSSPYGNSVSNDQESLLVELVQAKTAEATAKQEAEEAKQKLEALRKAYGLAPGDSPLATAQNNAGSGVMSMFGRLTGHERAPSADTSAVQTNKLPASTSTPSAAGNTGGFWGWRK